MKTRQPLGPTRGEPVARWVADAGVRQDDKDTPCWEVWSRARSSTSTQSVTITPEKLEIYKRYQGYLDGWARVNREWEHETITPEEWYEIDTLIQDIRLLKSGRASGQSTVSTLTKIAAMVSDGRVIAELEKLA